MKLNAILPFLIPVIIAGGLIGYNEMNDNTLLNVLTGSQPQEAIIVPTRTPELLQEQVSIKNEQNAENPQEEQITATNSEYKTKTVTLENNDVLLVTDTEVTLSNNNHNIKTNDIIAAGVLDNVPLGFLRKVTNISQENDKYLLQTEKASLSDAYANEIVNPVQDSNTNNNSYTFQPSDEDASQKQDLEFITELIETEATIAQKSYNCGSKGCFETSFKNCTPTIGIDEILKPYSQKTQYEIVGMGQNGCKVKTTFEISFFPDWEGKSITCELDNSLSITEAAGLIYQPNGSDNLNCQGELLAELKKYGY